MHMVVSFDCKFKGNQENIEKVLQHFGLRKVQSSLYIGKLDNNERDQLLKNIDKIIKNDSFLIFPICQSCFSKKEFCGREIKFNKDLYRVY